MTRTRSSGRPRISASSSRSMYGVWVRGEDLDAPVDDARGPGLGLDVRVLDVGGLERPGRGRGGRGQGGVDVAQPHEALDEDVPGRGLVEPRRGRVQRGVDPDQRRQRLPLDRQLVVGDRGHGRRVADERQHGLAAVADVALGEHRLVLAGRVDPVPVARPGRRRRPGSGRGPGGGRGRREVADPEARVRVRRADRPQVPGAVGRRGRRRTARRRSPWPARPCGRCARRPRRRPPGPGASATPPGRRRADGLDDRGVARCTGRARRPGRRGPRPSVGLGVRAMRSSAAISIPGVQAPHWAPPQARNAAWSARRAVGPGETLDRLDAPAVDLARGDEAGADLLAVEPHRARAAVAGVAAHLGAGQAEVLAQDVDEAPSPVRSHLDASPVDLEPEARSRRARDHAATSATARRTSVSAASQR